MGRAQGVRIPWERVPARVRAAIEERLGSRVVEARNQAGGFSPGLAARVHTAAGERIFIKAAGPELNPLTPGIHRREAGIAAALPAQAPVSRLRWQYDEGDDGWVVLAFADIDGRLPHHPWRRDELERVLAAVATMHAVLTPSPLTLPPAGRRLEHLLHGWRSFPEGTDALDSWSRRHLNRLRALEAAAPAAVDGDTMLHMDLRADNILLAGTEVVIVDWPGAAIGAPWLDVLGMAPSVELEGGPEAGVFFNLYPAARAAEPERVDAALASFAGFFTYQALQPPPPGLPTLRAFQAAQGQVARRWLRSRLALD